MRSRWYFFAVAIIAVALVGAYAILRQTAEKPFKPPFSQETLARAAIYALAHEDAACFRATLFSLDDIEEYIAAARATADSSETGMLDAFAQAQRADWPLYLDQMMKQFDSVLVRAEQLGIESPVYESFTFDDKHQDEATGRVIFGGWRVHMTEGDRRYVLQAEMMRQTADGWKLSGDVLYLYQESP